MQFSLTEGDILERCSQSTTNYLIDLIDKDLSDIQKRVDNSSDKKYPTVISNVIYHITKKRNVITFWGTAELN